MTVPGAGRSVRLWQCQRRQTSAAKRTHSLSKNRATRIRSQLKTQRKRPPMSSLIRLSFVVLVATTAMLGSSSAFAQSGGDAKANDKTAPQPHPEASPMNRPFYGSSYALALVIASVFTTTAPAALISFSGNSSDGHAVKGTAEFTLGAGTVTVKLTNTPTTTLDAGELLSGLDGSVWWRRPGQNSHSDGVDRSNCDPHWRLFGICRVGERSAKGPTCGSKCRRLKSARPAAR